MFYTYDILDDVLKMTGAFEKYFDSNLGRNITRKSYPYVNMYEKDDNIVLNCIMPGVNVEDINIELIDNSLVIKGERKADSKDNDQFIRKERNDGVFHKSVKLPYDVDRDNVNASLKDGVLIIELVKSEEAKPKRIEIK